ncbi:MAG: response regulator [Pseudonocardiaceae bacterium]
MINVLVVEDDQVAAEAHRLYVQRVAGFQAAGMVHSGAEAVRFCERHTVDIVLLDLYLPDTHGLAVCRALRAAGRPIYVIAVTSARDLDTVRHAVALGIAQYLLKPFTFASLRDKLERYAEFQQHVGRSGEVADQAEVDRLLAVLRSRSQGSLPKGITEQTLQEITAVLTAAPHGLSAAAAADAIGVSRVTARRYLEYLADNGLAQRRSHYGQVGRPEVRFSPAS